MAWAKEEEEKENQGQHGVAIDNPGVGGAACRSHAVEESSSTHKNGARRPGAGDHDMRAVECSGTHVQKVSVLVAL